jgi:glutathione S-transferase
MLAHDKRLARKDPPLTPEPTPRAAVAQVQTVAAVAQPRLAGQKVFCAARFTRGQIQKVDQIILLTHKERGVRLTQSDVLKQAVERMPVAPLEPGEVAEILAANGRKQLNLRTV